MFANIHMKWHNNIHFTIMLNAVSLILKEQNLWMRGPEVHAVIYCKVAVII